MPLTGDSIQLPNLDCTFSTASIPGAYCEALDDTQYANIQLDPVNHLSNDLGISPNSGSGGTNANCGSTYNENRDYTATGHYALTCFSIHPDNYGANFVAMNITVFDPNVSTSTGNAILDTLMPQVVTTFVEFLTQLFRDYWPFMLVLGVVAGFIKAFEKFFSSITK